ncbi:patatin-like phospholipase family protein, partial [Bacteroidales bacterium OttesenSCG-928-E04]|nr:patatin-like phospholipase family protein [Bacteroidales bacterium OttesenSCG-928-E04]
GKLQDVKNWMFSLDKKRIFSLLDVSISLNHIVKGNKIVEALKEVVPEANIEDLQIPFCAIASDLKNSKEVIYNEGSLYDAIRASISVPSLFKPLKLDNMVLVDGGLINPLPLNRIKRTDGDLLVAVNVSGHSDYFLDELRAKQKGIKLPVINKQISKNTEVDDNFYTLITKTISLMIQQNAALSIQLTPPDIIVDIPMNRYGGFDYDKAEKISRTGKTKMKEAITKYEAK